MIGPIATAQTTKEEKKAYLQYLQFSPIERKTGKNFEGKDVFEISGEVKNTGPRELKSLKLAVFFLDQGAQAVHEDSCYPISEYSIQDNTPLKSNYQRKFRCGFTDIPSDWAGQIRIEVTDMEFISGERESKNQKPVVLQPASKDTIKKISDRKIPKEDLPKNLKEMGKLMGKVAAEPFRPAYEGTKKLVKQGLDDWIQMAIYLGVSIGCIALAVIVSKKKKQEQKELGKQVLPAFGGSGTEIVDPITKFGAVRVKESKTMTFMNPANGHKESVSLLAPVWVFFFGFIYLALKGEWRHAVASFLLCLVIGAITGGIGAILIWLCYPFFVRGILKDRYLKNGWVPVK